MNLHEEGVSESILADIMDGIVTNYDSIQTTYLSLILREDMTKDLLMYHLISAGKRIACNHRREYRLAQDKRKTPTPSFEDPSLG